MAKIKTQAALAAKELKKQLTVRFPNVRFSVNSENYSGGNSVNVYWSFGPTEKEVKNLSSSRQHGYFDGMTDMYEYQDAGYGINEQGEIAEVASVKFVFENRNVRYQDRKKTGKYYELRDDVFLLYGMLAEMLGYTLNLTGNDYVPGQFEGIHNTASNKFYRIINDCNFISDNIELLEIKMCDCNYEDTFEPYTIIYKDLNTQKIYDAKKAA